MDLQSIEDPKHICCMVIYAYVQNMSDKPRNIFLFISLQVS